MTDITFQEFPKMARYSRECIITEKIDGTNGQIYIVPTSELSCGKLYPDAVYIEDFSQPDSVAIFAGSRNRWVAPGYDNAGFAAWVVANGQELKKLGPGRHFGEWWGSKIQRTYGRKDRVFSLFNVNRWVQNGDMDCDGVHCSKTGVSVACCRTVPIIAVGEFNSDIVDKSIYHLRTQGSEAQPGFMQPEGIVIWHYAANIGFKKTLLNDETPKSVAPRNPASDFNKVCQ